GSPRAYGNVTGKRSNCSTFHEVRDGVQSFDIALRGAVLANIVGPSEKGRQNDLLQFLNFHSAAPFELNAPVKFGSLINGD
ncbi:hypothetical protein, partial [Acidovorax temperans]|uniref:hypothetical protein n=1 Tax=Acidovorax temperans TaxID=80878 RepID=UPI001427CA46